MRAILLSGLFCGALAGCTHGPNGIGPDETVLPLNRAWVDGRMVEYVTTDISDLTMARAEGVNHVPSLARALSSQPGNPLIQRVYKFTRAEQISIFQSAPSPVGADNRDRHYSPLWRMVLVHPIRSLSSHPLRSEEALLQAQEQGDVRLEVTDIVVNCPITREVSGSALKGVR